MQQIPCRGGHTGLTSAHPEREGVTCLVIPAEAGIQCFQALWMPAQGRHDGEVSIFGWALNGFESAGTGCGL